METAGHKLKVPVVRRPEYTIEFEQYGTQTFAHCAVRKWNHGVLRRLAGDAEAALRLHGGPVYALGQPRDPRHPHFMSLLAFVPIGTALTADGERVLLYERTIPDGITVRRRHDDPAGQ